MATLVDDYLGHLYPDYVSHTRPVLVRQARDLLVCTFHGDLLRFEQEFLCPAAKIVSRIKDLHQGQTLMNITNKSVSARTISSLQKHK